MMRHLILTGALCAILLGSFPHCREAWAIGSTGNLPVFRMNNAAFASELCMWARHGRICAHETACSSAEYQKGRCL